ncbi:MAG: Nif3-like dinuclear metal center hexameric protein [Spirochaetota bacterium]
MQRSEIIEYLEELFSFTKEKEKYATNGLQLEGCAEVSKLAFAVDATSATISKAIETQADMLICHHGLFWPSIRSITGPLKKQIGLLLQHDISLVGMHLPLDKHPEVGNNISMIRLLQGKCLGEIASVSYLAEWPELRSLTSIKHDLEKQLSTQVRLFDFSKGQAKTFAVCTGSGSSELYSIFSQNCDLFITGEIRYEIINQCKEYGVSLMAAGHYATETTGIQSLQKRMADDLALDTVYIEDRIAY